MGVSITFPPSMLSESRERGTSSMDATAAIYAPMTARDPKTGITGTTYPAVTATARCRVGQLTAEERLVAERLAESYDAALHFPVNTPMGHAYQVIVTGQTNGVPWTATYNVVGIDSPRSYEIERRVRVRTLRTGAV